MIFQWKSHILRAENQERAKQDVLKSLQDNSVLVVMDWAMNFFVFNYGYKCLEALLNIGYLHDSNTVYSDAAV